MNQDTLAILMVFGVALVAVIGRIIIAALKVFKGDGSGRSRDQDMEETRMIQDMYQGFRKMEQRIEALETILLERERKEANV